MKLYRFIVILLLYFYHDYIKAQTPLLKVSEIATGFFHPTDIATLPDGRLFVSQLDGKIQVVQNGVIAPVPFLDIAAKVKDTEWSGIFGFCFHPNYAQNGYVYVHYIPKNLDVSVYARFTRSASNATVLDPASEQVIITVPYPANGHRSGHLGFGKDGYLYITTGDGADGARGSVGDINGNAQNLHNLFGKILRIDVNHSSPYSIPVDNPYQTPNDNIPDEIWARGLRNPWHWSFDRQTGDLWIGDNGQDDWEEVNFTPINHQGGLNYGWRCYQGAHPYFSSECAANTPLQMPLLEYGGFSTNGIGGSVLGGFVYRGASYPSLQGWYVYADYQTGKFWTLKRNTDGSYQNFSQSISLNNPVSFGEDSQGELYVITFYEGKLYQLSINQIQSVNSGSWQSPSTWNCSCIPTVNDEVIIQSGHTISLNQDISVRYLQVKGSLHFNGNQVMTVVP